MKKFLAFIALILILSLSVFASDKIAEGTLGENVKWVLDSDGTITFTGEGEMEDLGWASDFPWYNDYQSQITAVVIGDGITSIPSEIFNNYYDVASITIADSVKTIGSEAFSYCKKVESLTLSAETIGEYAFASCNKLSSLTLCEGVKTIEKKAFSSCAFSSVTVPASVVYIGDRALESMYIAEITVSEDNTTYSSAQGVLFDKAGECLIHYPDYKSDTAYTVPDGVITIYDEAFLETYNLKSVVLPDTVEDIFAGAFRSSHIETITLSSSLETIGSQAFCYCSRLTEIVIPASVTSISIDSFDSCNSLASIEVSEGNSKYYSENGVLLEINGYDNYGNPRYTLFRYPVAKTDTTYTLPKLTTKIGERAFNGANNLEAVNFVGIEEIGARAFLRCTALKSITLDKHLKTLGQYAFQNCTSLETVKIFSPITELPTMVFYGCTALKTAVLPDSVTAFGYNCFGGCESVTIYGEAGGNIYAYAVNNGIPFEEYEPDLLYVKVTPSSKTEYYVGESLVYDFKLLAYFEDGTSSDVTSKAVIGAETVTGFEEVGTYTITIFYKSASASFEVTVVEAPVKLEYIKITTLPVKTEYKYGDKLDLTGMVVTAYFSDGTTKDYTDLVYTKSDSITEIKEQMIEVIYSNEADNVWLSDCFTVSVTSDFVAFEDHGAFKWTLDKNGVLTVTGNAVLPMCYWEKYKPEIKKAVFGDGIENVPVEAFRGANSLESVTLAQTVESIESTAFYGCHKLESITLPENLKMIHWSAFEECTSLKEIHIPASLEMVAERAFAGCISLEKFTADFESNDMISVIDGVLYDGNCKSIISYPAAKSDTLFIIPDTVEIIYSAAFSDAVSLEEVVLQPSVMEIHMNAFDGCTSIKSVYIPASVISVDMMAFANCTSLEAIKVNRNNEFFTSVDGVLYGKNKDTLVSYPAGKTDKVFTPTNELTFIMSGAFAGNKYLESFTAPKSIRELGERMFENCTSLKTVKLHSDICYIDAAAFNGCTSLTDLEISRNNMNYRFVDGAIFDRDMMVLCRYLPSNTAKTYTVPQSVEVISKGAFEDVKYLEEITLPAKLMMIEDRAFAGCTSLKNVYIPWRVNMISSEAFAECTSLESVEISGNANLSSRVFSGCTSLETVILYRNVNGISGDTFSGSNPTLYVAEGSFAEDFAKNEGIEYVSEKREHFSHIKVTPPAKTVYNFGEALDTKGLKVTAYYWPVTLDNTTSTPDAAGEVVYTEVDVTDYAIIEQNGIFMNEGMQCVTVNYRDVLAEFEVSVESDYYAYGNCGPESVWTLDEAGNLRIFGKGNVDYPEWEKTVATPENNGGVTPDEDEDAPVYLTSVTVEDGIFTLPGFAFANSELLESVEIADSVREIGPRAFEYCTSLKSIELPESLYYLGEAAFHGSGIESIAIPEELTVIGLETFMDCESLKSVDFGSCLENIETNAFSNCGALEFVTIPDSVEYIGSFAFSECLSLGEVKVGSGICSIPQGAFLNCTALHTVTLSEGVETICTEAFMDCTSLKNVKTPSTLTMIEGYAFSNCSSLEEIKLTGKINEINWAFEKCSSLKRIYLPASVEYIDIDGFFGCDSLVELVIDEDNRCYSFENGMLFDSKKSMLYYYFPANGAKSITVPDTVEYIFESAFEGYNTLEEITFPISLNEIGYRAFADCTSLKKVTIPWSVGYISDEAFLGCTALASVEIEGEASIGYNTFADCTSLERVFISENSGNIDENAFNGSDNVVLYVAKDSSAEEYAIANGIEYVSEERITIEELIVTPPEKTVYKVFEYLDTTGIKVEAVYSDGTVVDVTSKSRIEWYGRLDCDGEVLIDVNYRNVYADFEIFVEDTYVAYGICGDWSVWTLDEDGTLTVFGEDELQYCDWNDYKLDIKKVVVENGITSIGPEAFGFCEQLESVTLPETLKYIGSKAFFYSTALKEIVIPDGVKYIDEFAFEGCEALESVTVPASVTEIYKNAFSGCKKVTIYGYKGSYAEKYANECGIAFEALGSVVEKTLVSISVTERGVVDYTVGDLLDTTGLVVMATYSDGTTEKVTDKVTVKAPTLDAPGVVAVTVTLEDKTAVYYVNVAEKVVEPEEPENIAEGTIENINWVITADGVLTVSGEGAIPTYTKTSNAPWTAYAKQITKIVVSDGVTGIGNYAFYKLSKATYIEVAKSVVAVGQLFLRDSGITEIALPGVVNIAVNAFGASSVNTIALSEAAKGFKGNVFGSSQTVTVKAPENSFAHKYAEYYAEKYGTSNKLSYVSDGTVASRPVVRLTSAGDNAFFAIYENSKGAWLLEVSGSGTMKNFPYVSDKNIARGYTFSPMYYISEEGLETKVATITVHEGITTVGNYIFYKCTKATTVTLPEGIKSVGQGAFRLCQRIAKITLPEEVTKIEKNAFLSCGKLTEIYIPEGVTTVGEGIFEKCTLETLTVKTKSAAAIAVISAEYPTVTIVSDF